MRRATAAFALKASAPPPPTPRARRARSYDFITFLLRRYPPAALVRESHARARRRTRYGNGDKRRSDDLRCNVSGRRTPPVDTDCKHSANPLDSGYLDAVAARALLPLIRDDDGARVEAHVRQGPSAAYRLPHATPTGLVRNQLDGAPALVRAHRPRRQQRELDRLRLFRWRLRDARARVRAFVAEHRHAEDFHGRHAVAQQAVVEVAYAERVAHALSPLVAQAHDLHLAESVDEIGRVERAATRLALGVRARLIALAHEELDGLVVTHPGGGHPYADDVAAQTQQRRVQLREPELRVVSAEALVNHHLLAVVRPALYEARRAERRADARRRLP